jgi:hypothetical protein
MGAYLIQRFLLLIPTFIGVTIISFLIMRLAPGDPAELRAGGGLRGAGESGISTEKGVVDGGGGAAGRLDKPLPIVRHLMKNPFTLILATYMTTSRWWIRSANGCRLR